VERDAAKTLSCFCEIKLFMEDFYSAVYLIILHSPESCLFVYARDSARKGNLMN
jgi:hypothetical protein